MLHSMQQAAQTVAPPTQGGFAGILAALSGPAQKSVPAWNDEGLEEDVATLSYEHALRTHARYRPAAGEDPPRVAELPPLAEPVCGTEASRTSANPGSEAARRARESLERNLKRASVTVRLSEEESAQLRKRAGEAGLTVSAYLRSCTFEAEALRAQVKEALAELRTGGSKPIQAAVEPVRRSGAGMSWLRLLLRPFLFWHRNQREAQA
jgi:hypothetical protein